MRHIVVVLCTLAALAACHSASRERIEPPASLSRAFSVLELRRGVDTVHVPHGTLVDYESEVFVQPDHATLADLAGSKELNPLSSETRAMRDRTGGIQRALETALSNIVAYESESRNFYTNEFTKDTIWQDNESWRRLTQKQHAAVTALKHLAYTYVNVTDYDGKWRWENVVPSDEGAPDQGENGIAKALVDAANDKVSELHQRFSPTAETYAPDEITKIANELLALFRARIDALKREALKNAEEAELEMEAALLRGKERFAVSIDPYTVVEGYQRGGAKSIRVGIPSQGDVERIRKEYAAYADVAKSVNELIALAGDKARLDAARRALVESLSATAANVQKSIGKQLDDVIANTQSELADVRTRATNVRRELESIIDLVKVLHDEASTMTPLALTNAAVALAGSLSDKAGNLRSEFDSLLVALKVVQQSTPEVARELVKTTLELVEKEVNQLIDAVADLPAAGSLASLFTSTKRLVTLSKLASFADLDPGDVTSRSFAIADAPVGVVNLANTPAESGDVLELTQRLTAKAPPLPDGQRTPLREFHSASFLDVRKFGLYTTFGSQLIFYDGLRDGTSAFRAAPGIYPCQSRPRVSRRSSSSPGSGPSSPWQSASVHGALPKPPAARPSARLHREICPVPVDQERLRRAPSYRDG